MKRLPYLVAIVLLAGCRPGSREVEPEPKVGVSDVEVAVFDIRPYGDIPYMAYINPIDQQIALSRREADGGDVPCKREKILDGETVNTTLPIDQCVFMEPAMVWHGLWLNQYEHSVFCPTEANQTECDGAKADIWLTPGLFDEANGERYRISFIGRKTRYSGDPGGYGHLSSHASAIIVDRLISIEATSKPEN